MLDQESPKIFRRALVTGGSSGIGKGIVYQLLAEGFTVTGTYHTGAAAAAQMIGADSSGRLSMVPLDLCQRESMPNRFGDIAQHYGPFDIFIHSAGKTIDGPMYLMDAESWQNVIDIALQGFFFGCKACLPHMIGQRWGRIVSLVSPSGECGRRGQANYAAAKGALIAASKSLSYEVASRGITVNCVSPGLIETPMTAQLSRQDLEAQIPTRRFGRIDEVVHGVMYLVSEKASYVTGDVLRINGGLHT